MYRIKDYGHECRGIFSDVSFCPVAWTTTHTHVCFFRAETVHVKPEEREPVAKAFTYARTYSSEA